MSGRTWLAIVSLTAACADEPTTADANEVVALGLEGDWTKEARQAARNAGAAWNLEFGTRVRLSEFGDEELVSLSFGDDACSNSRRQATHARALTAPPTIRICPKTGEDRVLLFETIRHELGHILGIPVHATDDQAVMTGRATELAHWFRDEDRDLFFGANDNFAGQTGCAVSPKIADGTPMLVQGTEDVHLIWAKRDGIRVAPLSKNGLIGAQTGHLLTSMAASSLDAHPMGDGFLVTWFEENRFNLSSVTMPGSDFSEPRVVQLDSPANSFYRVSEQHAAPYYWLALTVREGETNTPRSLSLYQIDQTSGSIIGSRELPMTAGELVARDGQVFLITAEIDPSTVQNHVRIHRIAPRADGFDLTESIDIASIPYVLTELGAQPEPILTAQSTSAGIIMLLAMTEAGAVDLVRATTEGSLAVESTMPMPVVELHDPTILEAAGRLFIAGAMPSEDHYENELYVLGLAPDTLAIVDPWIMLSAADSIAAGKPRLAYVGDGLVTVWSESSGDVRSRCSRLE